MNLPLRCSHNADEFATVNGFIDSSKPDMSYCFSLFRFIIYFWLLSRTRGGVWVHEWGATYFVRASQNLQINIGIKNTDLFIMSILRIVCTAFAVCSNYWDWPWSANRHMYSIHWTLERLIYASNLTTTTKNGIRHMQIFLAGDAISNNYRNNRLINWHRTFKRGLWIFGWMS